MSRTPVFPPRVNGCVATPFLLEFADRFALLLGSRFHLHVSSPAPRDATLKQQPVAAVAESPIRAMVCRWIDDRNRTRRIAGGPISIRGEAVVSVSRLPLSTTASCASPDTTFDHRKVSVLAGQPSGNGLEPPASSRSELEYRSSGGDQSARSRRRIDADDRSERHIDSHRSTRGGA